ncbi:uncharacterized protein LOC132447676 [Gadus macrocephalus]|uniref:uncharacterized protein LOC132447676 n=1 Tax=Gadus macrocephalus TaxID=80720 RepID=UPI0028CB376E|nr:uncharacterized protein LOC132447676 [Gadus macrocephalus]
MGNSSSQHSLPDGTPSPLTQLINQHIYEKDQLFKMSSSWHEWTKGDLENRWPLGGSLELGPLRCARENILRKRNGATHSRKNSDKFNIHIAVWHSYEQMAKENAIEKTAPEDTPTQPSPYVPSPNNPSTFPAPTAPTYPSLRGDKENYNKTPIAIMEVGKTGDPLPTTLHGQMTMFDAEVQFHLGNTRTNVQHPDLHISLGNTGAATRRCHNTQNQPEQWQSQQHQQPPYRSHRRSYQGGRGRGRGSSPRRPATCYNCGQKGHCRNQCHQQPPHQYPGWSLQGGGGRRQESWQCQSPRRPATCYNCGQKGHYRNQCHQHPPHQYPGWSLQGGGGRREESWQCQSPRQPVT